MIGRHSCVVKFVERNTERQKREKAKERVPNERMRNKTKQGSPKETEKRNFPDKEFIVIMVITICYKLGRRIKELSDNFNNDLENVITNQS